MAERDNKMENNKPDRRKGTRVNIKHSEIKIIPESGIFAFFKGSKKAYSVINISEKGLKLVTLDNFPDKTEMSFTIAIPTLGAEPVSATGRVIWAKPLRNFNTYMVGIEFSSMPADTRKRIKHLVSFLGRQVDHTKYI
jgi:c-di-GMP-binding flagellar brake protein YcgR